MTKCQSIFVELYAGKLSAEDKEILDRLMELIVFDKTGLNLEMLDDQTQKEIIAKGVSGFVEGKITGLEELLDDELGASNYRKLFDRSIGDVCEKVDKVFDDFNSFLRTAKVIEVEEATMNWAVRSRVCNLITQERGYFLSDTYDALTRKHKDIIKKLRKEKKRGDGKICKFFPCLS